MKIDPEQRSSRDPQILKNISAHARGQSYDLTEIDYVYKVFRVVCPKSDKFTVEYWNDRDQLLLVLPCKEAPSNVNTKYQGAPAQAIPIQAVWQDMQATPTIGGLPLNINTALQILAGSLGLPPQILQLAGGSLDQALLMIGKGYLEDLLGLPAGTLAGNNLESMLKSTFDAKLAELLGTLPRSTWGANLPDWARSAAADWWEREIGLLPGSLQGWSSPESLFKSIALETVASFLRVPSDLLLDPLKAGSLARLLNADDLNTLGSDPLGQQILGVIAAMQQGNLAGQDGALRLLGENILEQALELPLGILRSCTNLDCPDIEPGLQRAAERLGVDLETLKRLLATLRTGGPGLVLDEGLINAVASKLGVDPGIAYKLLNLVQSNSSVAALELAIGLPEGSLSKLLGGGTFNFDAATIEQVAQKLGIDKAVAQRLLDTLERAKSLGGLEKLLGLPEGVLSRLFSGGDLGSLFKEMGLPLLEEALGLPDGFLQQVLSGQIQNLDPSAIAAMARKLGIDTGLVDDLLKKIGLGQELLGEIQRIGSRLLGGAFDLSDLDSLYDIAKKIAPPELIKRVEEELRNLTEKLNLPVSLADLQKILSGDPSAIIGLMERLGGIKLGDIFGLSLGDIQRLINGDIGALLNNPKVQEILQNIAEMMGTTLSKLGDIFKGSPALAELARLGDQFNGLISLLGLDQMLVLEGVYKPEARYKVHLAIKELLAMPITLKKIDLRVTQLITHSYERDVKPFEMDGTLDKVYGKGRNKNFGLCDMKEAFDHLHIGY